MKSATSPRLRRSVVGRFLPILFAGAAANAGLGIAASDIPPLSADRWVNSPPLTVDGMRGKVVLIDVWEYTCINWIRTAPYTKSWDRLYARHGLLVVGVHAPEFEFGKRAEHIDRGIADHSLIHPIAIDNSFTIWRGLHNNAWPAKYLYDAQGKLVRRWIGEGSYDEIEAEIRMLLVAAKPSTQLPPTSAEATAFSKSGMPSYAGITAETYVGTDRREPRTFSLRGEWRSEREYVELRQGTGEIVLPFVAGEVNLVVQPGASGQSSFTVLLDGKPIDAARGADVGANGIARFDRSGMIRLVAKAPPGRHTLTLIASEPGVRAYVFTFGP